MLVESGYVRSSHEEHPFLYLSIVEVKLYKYWRLKNWKRYFDKKRFEIVIIYCHQFDHLHLTFIFLYIPPYLYQKRKWSEICIGLKYFKGQGQIKYCMRNQIRTIPSNEEWNAIFYWLVSYSSGRVFFETWKPFLWSSVVNRKRFVAFCWSSSILKMQGSADSSICGI